MLTKTSAFWLLAYAERSSSVSIAVVVSRHEHAQPEPALDQRAQAAGDAQRDVFLERAARARGAALVAAMAGVDHDRPDARRRRDDLQRSAGLTGPARRRWRDAGVSGEPAIRSSPAAARSRAATRSRRAATSSRDGRQTSDRSPGGPMVGPSGLQACRKSGGGSVRQRQVQRVGFEGSDEAAGLERDARRGRRRHVEGDGRAGRRRSTRPATRGTRMSPRRAVREGRRRSMRVSSAGPSARERNSSGSSQRLPCRMGACVNDTRRPATETTG